MTKLQPHTGTIEIEIADFALSVEYHYTPGREQIYEGPGYPAEVEIVSVKDCDGRDYTPLDAEKDKEITEACFLDAEAAQEDGERFDMCD